MNFIASARKGFQTLKANRGRLFWAWIAYQSIKGAITLSLIWVPLLILWLKGWLPGSGG